MSENMVLLTGASGTLGAAIKNSDLFGSLLLPSHEELDITNYEKVQKYLFNNDFDILIHCAALARMQVCEENKKLAYSVNDKGTKNLVDVVLLKEENENKKIRFIHISTDGVYAGTGGNYSEESEANPYNVYGESKLAGEFHVRALEKYCIIRTSFFDPSNIRFKDSATDAYSSKMPIGELVSGIRFLMDNEYIGIINVGREKRSDFEHYSEFKSDLKKTSFKKIQNYASFPLAKDASMNIDLWKKLDAENKQ